MSPGGMKLLGDSLTLPTLGGTAAGAVVRLLDAVPGAAVAYATTRLAAAFTGPTAAPDGSAWYDQSGAGLDLVQADPARRPAVSAEGLTFAGAQALRSPSAGVAGASAATLYVRGELRNEAGTGLIAELSTSFGLFPGALAVYTYDSVPGDIGFGLNGTNAEARVTAGAAVPRDVTLSCVFDFSQPTRETQIRPVVDGAVPATTGAGGVSALGDFFGAQPLYVGARGGTSLFLDGTLRSLVLYPAAHDDATRALVESLL